MNTILKNTIAEAAALTLPESRKKRLLELAAYIRDKRRQNAPIRLNFICTHNSRRSHLAQIWAQTMAFYHGFPEVFCYSGGTEATAVFPQIITTLIRQGFDIFPIAENIPNPVYAVKFSENAAPVIAFSKKYDHGFNPNRDFGAVMTCSSADQGCPLVAGAETRWALAYDDPKDFDHTESMNEKYLAASLSIAAEMHFVFQSVK